jgi:hypothetical protein
VRSGDTATYDAWNRLVKVNLDANHDQWYEYLCPCQLVDGGFLAEGRMFSWFALGV